MEVFRLFGRILVDDKEAQKSLSKTDKNTKKLGDRLRGGIATAAKWGTAIVGATVGVATAAFAMTKKVTEGFDHIAKTSAKMGVTTDFYQELDYWASQNGISQTNMEKGLQRLNQRVGEARAGNKKYSEALKEIGVDMKALEDGTLSSEDAMVQAMSSLSKMTNEQDKSALASEFFGKKLAQELMPALQDGSLSLDEAQKKAEELGIVIEEDTLRAAEEFNDTWDDLVRSFKAFGAKGLSYLMPFFQGLMDWVMDHMPQIQAVFETVFKAIEYVFSNVAISIGFLMDVFNNWREENAGTLDSIREKIESVIENVVEFLQERMELLQEFWNEHGDEIMKKVRKSFDTIRKLIIQAIDAVVPFVQQKLEQLLEFWDENGVQIMEIVRKSFNFIKDTIIFLMPVIVEAIKVAWHYIETIINSSLDLILGLIKVFTGVFTGDWKKTWEGIKQILSGVWQAIYNLTNLWLVSKFLGLIKQTMTNIVNNIKSRINNMKSAFSTGLQGIFNNVRNSFNKILGVVTGLGTSFFNAGKNIITSIVNGIKNSVGKVKDAVSGVASTIRNFFPFSEPKDGPLRGITKIAFGDTIGEAIERDEDKIREKMEHMLHLPEVDKLNFDNNSAIDSGQQVVININAQGTSDDELDRIFTYINRRFGMEL